MAFSIDMICMSKGVGYMLDVCGRELTIIMKHGTQNVVIIVYWIKITLTTNDVFKMLLA